MSAMEKSDSFNTPALSEAEVANGESHRVRYHYSLEAEAESDSLCRVLNLFALQCLLPHGVEMRQKADLLLIDIAIDGLSWNRALLIEQKMRNLICVCEVALRTVLLPLEALGKARQCS